MSSSWIRTGLKYALLFTPVTVLTGLVVLVAIGAWVTVILRDPSQFDRAPILVQKFTRATYWHTRRHWHTVPECVLFDPDLLYRPRPGECLFENAEFRTLMHFDDRGARRTADPAPAAARTRPRLLILGDSHAMGWGVDDEQTFASWLAAEYGYPTVNLAVSSYATPRELRRLERDFMLRPDDVIIIQYCDNDYPENRQFATTGRIGPYLPSQLERLFGYPRTKVAALPIAGLLLRQFSQYAIDRLTGQPLPEADGPDPSQSLLAVLRASPHLRRHRMLVVAINDPENRTHLSVTQLAAAGVHLIVPALNAADFFSIDDHMRPSGHRKVAQEIDAQISSLAVQASTEPQH